MVRRRQPEKFKWYVLDVVGDTSPAGYAFGTAEELFPELGMAETEELARRTLLELFDEGLIVFYRSRWDDAYQMSDDEIQRAAIGRADLVAWLEEGWTHEEEEPELEQRVFLWGRSTEKGKNELRGRELPAYSPP